MLEYIKNDWINFLVYYAVIILAFGIYLFYNYKRTKNLPKVIFITSKIGIPISFSGVLPLLMVPILATSLNIFFIFLNDMTDSGQDKVMIFGMISLGISVFCGSILSKYLELKNAKKLENYKKKREIFDNLLKIMSERLCETEKIFDKYALFCLYIGQLTMVCPAYRVDIIREQIEMFWKIPTMDLYDEIAVLFKGNLEID